MMEDLILYVSQKAGPGNDARVDMQIRERNAKIHIYTPTQTQYSQETALFECFPQPERVW